MKIRSYSRSAKASHVASNSPEKDRTFATPNLAQWDWAKGLNCGLHLPPSLGFRSGVPSKPEVSPKDVPSSRVAWLPRCADNAARARGRVWGASTNAMGNAGDGRSAAGGTRAVIHHGHDLRIGFELGTQGFDVRTMESRAPHAREQGEQPRTVDGTPTPASKEPVNKRRNAEDGDRFHFVKCTASNMRYFIYLCAPFGRLAQLV